MTTEAISREILSELQAIKSDLGFIKEHMVDADTILTPEERRQVQKAREEHERGETIPLEQIEKEFNDV